MSVPDLAIVGGGPAGLATAIVGAQRGLTAVVLDARALPSDKACGEGLMPPGAALLEEMGVRLPADSACPFSGIRYVDGDRTVEAAFPSRPGIAARRPVLHRALLERARFLGVAIHESAPFHGFEEDAGGVRVRAGVHEVRARFVVGADGLHSAVRRAIGVESRPGRRPRIGVRRHFEVDEVPRLVEVHWAEGVEAYLTPVDPRTLGVALLAANSGPGFDGLLSRFPALSARLAGRHPVTAVRGAGPFSRGSTRRVRGRAALVGDAAGFVDPIAGDGLASAFLAARALVDVVVSGRPLSAYERSWRRATRRLAWFSRFLLLVSRHPSLRHELMSLLARRPPLFSRLLALAVGDSPSPSFGLGDVAGALRALGRAAFFRS